MTRAELQERFEFRNVRAEEADQTIVIENICFPPNEACSPKSMTERASQAQETFLVAVDKETGKIAGFLNGIATDEEVFRDEFFTDIRLHNIKGKNIMILGLDVLPEYRGQGLAREIMERYLKREKECGRRRVVLTCLDEKVKMYEKMGYKDLGISGSVWGGEKWHDMEYLLFRTKKFDIKPMYPEDACIQMELLGHNFFAFVNAETDDICVVYKRKGGTYGIMEPDK